MTRLFGIGVPRRTSKRRLNESAGTAQSMRERHPMYEYAMKEYAQTVGAGTSNDDGLRWNQQRLRDENDYDQQQEEEKPQQHQEPLYPIVAPSLDHNSAAAIGLKPSYMMPPSVLPPSSVPSSRYAAQNNVKNNNNNNNNNNNSVIGQPQPTDAAAHAGTLPSVGSAASPLHEDRSSEKNHGGAAAQHHHLSDHHPRSSSSEFPHIRSSTSAATTNTSSHSSAITSAASTDAGSSVASSSAFGGGISQRLSSLRAEPALSRDYYSANHPNNSNNNAHSNSNPNNPNYYYNSELERVNSTATNSPRYYVKSPFEEGMVSGILYEEWYGDAYTGAPIKYVYPRGYQSMRPRSGPWRLSILICMCFTWLSVFVVGHCSDRVLDAEMYNAMNNIDDDTLLIDIRWCGSRPLYLMWLASMLITGLSAAYCGVIGYIKCRDFAVANARAQPAPVGTAGPNEDPFFSSSSSSSSSDKDPYYSATAPSDYYLALDEDYWQRQRQRRPNSSRQQQQRQGMGGRTIYQADGTPQFWGSQIYRPTQAAVAVTSR
ncbi:hypothetical protein ACA910_002949 [Epithemia clementina (nom. ined.)]